MSEATTDLANRLMSLRSNPGYRDLFQLSQKLVNSTANTLVDYGGWDPQQIAILKARAQAAKEHHELLFAKITEAIREGIQEQAASPTLTDKTVREVLETGDYVRQEVLTRFSEMDQDGRLPGTY